MRTRVLLIVTVLLLVPMAAMSPAWADCEPWGGNTMSGDARYPEGWITSFGVIEISPPDEFVYAAIDGAAPVQQFLQIKAKLRNRITDHVMGPGTVTALARYHLRTDYQPDLSADPPARESRQEESSLSVSAPVTVSTIASDTPLQLIFDFTEQPIPAGITDLYFMVRFEGWIEGLEEPVTAIGLKDLKEPHHVTPWNNTDWFLVKYQLLTGQEIRKDSALMGYINDNCWYMDSLIDPMDLQQYIGFTAGEQDEPIFVAYYQNIPAGRYGRVIFWRTPKRFITMSEESVSVPTAT